MKIIIPMTGLGSRFIEAGYTDIKPLIPVHGKPMVSYVIDLFDDEQDFMFLCRQEHLKETNLEQTLMKYKPSGKIIPLKGEKLGPVYPVSQIIDSLDPEEPVIVSYCDFFQEWDYQKFKKRLQETGCDGAIPCYTGFHPHLRHEKNVYAGCRVDNNQTLIEIQEKHSFEKDKTKGQHSVGIYYFKHAKYISTYFNLLMEKNLKINNEFFVSMVYQLMLEDGLKIDVYSDIPKFCQWGTPEDYEEYLYWSNIIKEFKA